MDRLGSILEQAFVSGHTRGGRNSSRSWVQSASRESGGPSAPRQAGVGGRRARSADPGVLVAGRRGTSRTFAGTVPAARKVAGLAPSTRSAADTDREDG